jgi:hypothetical protein
MAARSNAGARSCSQKKLTRNIKMIATGGKLDGLSFALYDLKGGG